MYLGLHISFIVYLGFAPRISVLYVKLWYGDHGNTFSSSQRFPHLCLQMNLDNECHVIFDGAKRISTDVENEHCIVWGKALMGKSIASPLSLLRTATCKSSGEETRKMMPDPDMDMEPAWTISPAEFQIYVKCFYLNIIIFLNGVLFPFNFVSIWS